VKLEDKLFLLVVLNLFDYYLTLHAVELGATELNPLVAKFVDDPVKFSIVKLAIPTAALFSGIVVSPRIEPNYRNIVNVLINAILILYAAIVTMNAIQLVAYYMGLIEVE